MDRVHTIQRLVRRRSTQAVVECIVGVDLRQKIVIRQNTSTQHASVARHGRRKHVGRSIRAQDRHCHCASTRPSSSEQIELVAASLEGETGPDGVEVGTDKWLSCCCGGQLKASTRKRAGIERKVAFNVRRPAKWEQEAIARLENDQERRNGLAHAVHHCQTIKFRFLESGTNRRTRDFRELGGVTTLRGDERHGGKGIHFVLVTDSRPLHVVHATNKNLDRDTGRNRFWRNEWVYDVSVNRAIRQIRLQPGPTGDEREREANIASLLDVDDRAMEQISLVFGNTSGRRLGREIRQRNRACVETGLDDAEIELDPSTVVAR